MDMDQMNKAFTEDELKKLKSFFELMFNKYSREEYGSLESKFTDDNKTLQFYWDKSSRMGWHDESYHDVTKFTLTKNCHNESEHCEDASEHDDMRIRFIAENADICSITKHTQSNEFRYDHDEYVLNAEGFLNIPGNTNIIYSYGRGEW